MERKLLIIMILSGIVAALIGIVNYLYLREMPALFSSINLIALFVVVFPVAMVKYVDYRKMKEVEEMFPVFLRDFVETIRSGMTVPHAIKSVSKNDYRALTPYVKKMSAQMDWGISVEKVMMNFSKESKSKLIGRIMSSVVESHRFGGNLADTLEALSETSLEVERLRAERKLYLQSQMITGYIIFFVFLAVIIGLGKFLVPSLTQVSPGQLGAGIPTSPANVEEEYRTVFRNLILIQGLFAGLTVGKMAEGSLLAGLKHSLFMMFVGSLIFTLLA